MRSISICVIKGAKQQLRKPRDVYASRNNFRKVLEYMRAGGMTFQVNLVLMKYVHLCFQYMFIEFPV